MHISMHWKNSPSSNDKLRNRTSSDIHLGEVSLPINPVALAPLAIRVQMRACVPSATDVRATPQFQPLQSGSPPIRWLLPTTANPNEIRSAETTCSYTIHCPSDKSVARGNGSCHCAKTQSQGEYLDANYCHCAAGRTLHGDFVPDLWQYA
jgi:hypothetical protein